MTTNEKTTPKPTGKRYDSVANLLKGEGVDKSIQEKIDAFEQETRLVQKLVCLRHIAGLTQTDIATKLGITQGAVSKIENGIDEDLTLGHIKQYAKATGERIAIMFGKPLNHVEAVKAHAFGIKSHLTALAEIAHGDHQLERAIQSFFGEAMFNIVDILSKCQGEMPNGKEIEVKFTLLDRNPTFMPQEKFDGLIGKKSRQGCAEEAAV